MNYDRMFTPPITIYPIFIDIAGGDATVGHFLHWLYGQDRGLDGWVIAPYEEIHAATRLGRKAVNHARGALLKAGLIEEGRVGLPGQMRFRLNHERINADIHGFLTDSDYVPAISRREFGFEDFWALYPRKEEKALALRYWSENGLDAKGLDIEKCLKHILRRAPNLDQLPVNFLKSYKVSTENKMRTISG